MSRLFLVRHGQASYGAETYDELSELGHEQSEALGSALGREGLLRESAHHGRLGVIVGPAKRHRQTLEGIARGLGAPQLVEQASVAEGLAEFPAFELFKLHHTQALHEHDDPHDDEVSRSFATMVADWMTGAIDSGHLETAEAFVKRVVAVLVPLLDRNKDQLIVTSGGPVAVALQWALGTQPEVATRLMFSIHNSSLTTLAVRGGIPCLYGFNDIHFLEPAKRSFR